MKALHCLGPAPAQIAFSITHGVVYMPDERVLDLDQQQYTIYTSVVLVQRSDISLLLDQLGWSYNVLITIQISP